MAKDKDNENQVVEAPKVVRPKDLAEELEVDAKTLRSYLRKEFPRPAGEKNTSWALTEAQIEAARAHFADSEDEDSEEETEDEDEA